MSTCPFSSSYVAVINEVNGNRGKKQPRKSGILAGKTPVKILLVNSRLSARLINNEFGFAPLHSQRPVLLLEKNQ
jgi:hypothetical protein